MQWVKLASECSLIWVSQFRNPETVVCYWKELAILRNGTYYTIHPELLYVANVWFFNKVLLVVLKWPIDKIKH